MRRTRTSARTGAVAVAVGALVTATLLIAPATQAVPSAVTPASATGPAAQLGGRSAGAHPNTAGQTVVTATDTAAAVTRALDKSARIPGTAWAVEPRTGQVVVSVDQTVTGARLATVTAVASRFGSAVRLERVAGSLTPKIAGGDPVYGGGSSCTLGFNVRDSSNVYYFLTAGHCGNTAGTWYANSSHTTVLGPTVGSSFPGNDYALVKYTNAAIAHPGAVNLCNGSSQDISSAGNAYVGEPVKYASCRTGFVRSGTVTAVNATVNYAQGSVSGLIKTNICAEGGDSGGPLFDGVKALGLLSGGSGNCATGGTTYFQPITEALAVYGVTVY